MESITGTQVGSVGLGRWRWLASLAFVFFGGLVGAEVMVLLFEMVSPGLAGGFWLGGWVGGMAMALAVRPQFLQS